MAKFKYKKLKKTQSVTRGVNSSDKNTLFAKQLDDETARLYVSDDNGKVLEVVSQSSAKYIASLEETADTVRSGTESVIKDKTYKGVYSDASEKADFVVIPDIDFAKLTALIEAKVKAKTDPINTILQSDDTDLDTIQEIVNYIKQNRSNLSGLTDTKPTSVTYNAGAKKIVISLSDGSSIEGATPLIPDSISASVDSSGANHAVSIKLMNGTDVVGSTATVNIPKTVVEDEIEVEGNFE